MIKTKTNSGIYSIALILACIGMSVSFLRINIGFNFLRLAVIFVMLFFVDCIIKNKGKFKAKSFLLTFVLFMFSIFICLKSFYYGNLFLVGPLVTASCFLILISLIN